MPPLLHRVALSSAWLQESVEIQEGEQQTNKVTVIVADQPGCVVKIFKYSKVSVVLIRYSNIFLD